jgi:5'-3' exonuclease
VIVAFDAPQTIRHILLDRRRAERQQEPEHSGCTVTSGVEDDERSAPTPDRDDATFPIMLNDKLLERSLVM